LIMAVCIVYVEKFYAAALYSIVYNSSSVGNIYGDTKWTYTNINRN